MNSRKRIKRNKEGKKKTKKEKRNNNQKFSLYILNRIILLKKES